MSSQEIPVLSIDEEFRNLIRPLYRQEYLQLEANILADGCREPISVWNGIIVDGHNRYEICTKHNIPFSIREMSFEYREEVIAWICANQLGRRNLTDETRKYLIGLQYQNEKIVNSKKNKRGINQYSRETANSPQSMITLPIHSPVSCSRSKTAKRIADTNHISYGTVEKYSIYTRALDEIGKKAPNLVARILSGQYKISHKSVVELSKLSAEEIQRISRKLEGSQVPYARYMTTRKEISETSNSSPRVFPPGSGPSVKDMPAYDPDAEITGLTLTVPSWASSISRVRNGSGIHNASEHARNLLLAELVKLIQTINDMLDAIKEAV